MDRKNSSTMVACCHGAEIEALLRRQQELVTQLRALILPQLHDVDGGSAELAVQLFDDVISCNTGVVSRLRARRCGPAVELVDDKSLVRKKGTATSTGEGLEEQARPTSSVARKRRRNVDNRSRSLVTNVPHYDGHQWRKYGQKSINRTQHSRSYYRCAYKEQNCSATKTVQEQDQNGTFSYGEETAKYTVVYYGHHTCNKGDSITDSIDLAQLVNMDLDQSGEMATTEFQDFEEDFDVPALLEVLDNSLDWEIMC